MNGKLEKYAPPGARRRPMLQTRRSRRLARPHHGLLEPLESRMLLSTVLFAPQLPTNITSNAFSGTAADFNGDGKMDLVATNYNSNTVSVLLGKGDGTFLPKVDYAVGNGPTAVTSGNFGNGQLDLAVANANGNTVSILLGNGDGTFGTAVNYTVGQDPVAIVAGDFTGNNIIDLAVADYRNNSISVLMGNGDGTFAPAVSYTAGSSPFSVVAADFNGDGKLDLAVADFASNQVSVLLNNGNGTFATPISYGVGSNPRAIVAADFNGDGKMDLAAANSGSSSVSILLNNGSGFAPAVNYAAGSNPYAITAADFNGDGKPDIAVANYNRNAVSVLVNIGNGLFNIQNNVTNSNSDNNPPVIFNTGQTPSFILAADFTGDGLPDLAVGNVGDKTVGVLLNQTNAPLNLIANPSFESGNNAAWTLSNAGISNGTTSVNNITVTNAHSGTYEAQSGNNGGYLVQTVTGLTPDTTYQLTAYAMTQNKTTGETQVRVDHDGITDANPIGWIPGSTYTQTSITFTTGASTTTANVVLANYGNGTSYFDDISLIASPLANPGFEAGSQSWNISFGAAVANDPANAHSGNNVVETSTDGSFLWQALTGLTPNTTYQVSAWTKTIGKTTGTVLLRVDHDGTSDANAADFIPGTTYTQTSVTFTTGASTTTATVVLADFGDGTTYFDDLTLVATPVGSPLANGGFESGTASWNLSTGAAVATDPTNSHSGNKVAEVNTDGGFLWQALTGLTPNTTYQLTVWTNSSAKTTGAVTVRVDHDGISDANAANFIPTSYTRIGVTFTTGASTTTANIVLANFGDGTAYFDDLNLVASPVVNPDFESGSTGWNLSSNTTIYNDPVNSYSGSFVAEVSNNGGFLWQGLTNLQANTTYALTVWAKSSATGGSLVARVDHDGISSTNTIKWNPGFAYGPTTVIFTTGASTTTATIVLENLSGGTAYFDDLTLTALS